MREGREEKEKKKKVPSKERKKKTECEGEREKEKKFKVGSMNYKLSKISKWSIKEKIKEILNLI